MFRLIPPVWAIKRGFDMPNEKNDETEFAYSYICPDCGDEFLICFYRKPYVGCSFTCDCGRDILIDGVDDDGKHLDCSHIDYDGSIEFPK